MSPRQIIGEYPLGYPHRESPRVAGGEERPILKRRQIIHVAGATGFALRIGAVRVHFVDALGHDDEAAVVRDGVRAVFPALLLEQMAA